MGARGGLNDYVFSFVCLNVPISILSALCMRIYSIDFFRVIAILAVVFIHCLSFQGVFPFELLRNFLTRFAVPYFFIISSYFFSKKLIKIKSDTENIYWNFSSRILIIFVFWSFIYLLMPKFSLITKYGLAEGMAKSINERLLNIQDHPVNFLYTGSAPHLWFLTSLLLGISILTIMVRTKRQQLLPILAIILYIFGLTQGSYSELVSSDLQLNLNMGRLPFVLLFIAAGSILAKNDTRLRLTPIHAFMIVLFGFLLQFIEAILLWNFFAHPLEQHEFLIGTAISGIGLALLAVVKQNIGEKSGLAKLGKFTLGVYCIHLALINSPISWVIGKHFSYSIWQIIHPIFITVLSFALTILMSRISLLRKVVM